ncbi:MAG: class I lanthipeptide [Candidatus Aminicenantes bacterium]|nr:MAG: class I lanthipeptide [Candidatus Aminicenantes bacterium]
MKHININKKLVFKKETIADLKIDQLKEVQGGIKSIFTCYYTEPGCCKPTVYTCPEPTA